MIHTKKKKQKNLTFEKHGLTSDITIISAAAGLA